LNENLKAKAGLVYNVVESVILGMSVGLMVWLSNVVITHGQQLARQETRVESVDTRVNRLEIAGSPALVAHEKEDQARIDDIKLRVDKLEAAVIVLQATPGELKAISVSLETLHESQKRIEERLDKIKQ
jgi:chromosome segregation ATPase